CNFLDHVVVCRVVSPETVTIDQVQDPRFSSRHQFVGVHAGLVGQNQGTRGTQVEIVLLQLLLVVRGEIIGGIIQNAELGSVPAQFQNTIAEIVFPTGTVIGSIGGHDINAAKLVHRRS